MRFSVRLFICFILLAAVLLAEKFTNADTALQNLFYRPEMHEWLINPALAPETQSRILQRAEVSAGRNRRRLPDFSAAVAEKTVFGRQAPAGADSAAEHRLCPAGRRRRQIFYQRLLSLPAQYIQRPLPVCPHYRQLSGKFRAIQTRTLFSRRDTPQPVSPLWRCILFSTAAAEKSSDCLPAFCLAWRPDFTRCCADSTFCHIRSSA